MRFTEISEVFYRNAGVPSLNKMRCWCATYGGYSWVITYDPGMPNWSDEDRKQWQGYTASYRLLGQHSSKETIKVDGGPFSTFSSAEDACKKVWRGLRNLI